MKNKKEIIIRLGELQNLNKKFRLIDPEEDLQNAIGKSNKEIQDWLKNLKGISRMLLNKKVLIEVEEEKE